MFHVHECSIDATCLKSTLQITVPIRGKSWGTRIRIWQGEEEKQVNASGCETTPRNSSNPVVGGYLALSRVGARWTAERNTGAT